LRRHHKQGLVHTYSMKTTHLHTILIITHILRDETSEPSEQPPPPASQQDWVSARLGSAHERAEWPIARERRAEKRQARLGSLNHARRSARCQPWFQ
jgi:hypothetical protein